MVSACDALGIIGHQFPCSGEDIVEEKMVAGRGAEGVGGCALLFSELVKSEIDKIFVWKYGK